MDIQNLYSSRFNIVILQEEIKVYCRVIWDRLAMCGKINNLYLSHKTKTKIKMVEKLKQTHLGFMALLSVFMFVFTSCEKENLEDVGTANTKLQITVCLEDTKTAVDGCEVDIFSNYDDWDNLKNEVASGKTDNSGVVTFSNLSSKVYYISAWRTGYTGEGFWHNWDEDMGIKTETLDNNVTNKYIIYVRYYVSKSGEVDKTKFQVVRVERVAEKN